MPIATDLELVALTKRYGKAVAVDDINLKINAGTYCCLLGPSGCGKTSTLRMIAGHEAVTAGDIRLGDMVITDRPPAARGTAMMFQNYALFPHLTVADNVGFSLKMRGRRKPERRAMAEAMLRLVAMETLSKRLPSQLSGGGPRLDACDACPKMRYSSNHRLQHHCTWSQNDEHGFSRRRDGTDAYDGRPRHRRIASVL